MPNRRIWILLIGVAIASLCMLLLLHDAPPQNSLTTNVVRMPYTVHNDVSIAVTFAADLVSHH